ncbi:MAG: phosphoglycolate phosphatase, partial [Gammaproteobacteria bacterium]|nr:phosphoglycolate phosphatase [Gammaproteobacteria bacterium]
MDNNSNPKPEAPNLKPFQRPGLVLMDMDGTMIDSVPDLAFSINAMMTELDLPQRGEEQVRNWVGNGVENLVRRALTGTMEGKPDEIVFQQAMPLFLEAYQQNTSQRSVLYPGVKKCLDLLHAQGCILSCITNKATRFTDPLLRELELWDNFALVISGDTLPKKKPDPLPLQHAATHFGVAPERSLMVGDSVNDIQAARAANFGIVCVSYGYNHGADIREAR